MTVKNRKKSSVKGGQEQNACMKILYNKDTGEFVGRTMSSWVKISIFYIFFFAGLAAFFCLMMYIFYCTLSTNRPMWTQEKSIIGTNPGVGYRPMPDPDVNSGSTLIWFKKDSESDWKFWSNELSDYLSKYENGNQSTSSNLETCTIATVRDEKDRKTKVCKVDVAKFGPCNEKDNFGYNKGQPCILIKLNKIWGWEPIGLGTPWDYNSNIKKEGSATMASLKEALDKKSKSGMPKDLISYVEKEAAKHKEDSVEFKNIVNTVWMSCEGSNPTDKENIGPVNFYPMPGIPGYYYPYVNQTGYQQPFVMLQLSKPKIGQLINIECIAWALNISPDRSAHTGSVHLEVLVD